MVSTQPLQPLDVTSLRAVLGELRAAVVPSRFEKAQQSASHTVQLGLRSLDGMRWLEISWMAEAPRLLAIPAPRRQGDGSTLAQQLQHGLKGLALVELAQDGWERVVHLRFAARPGEPPQRQLVVELMGRHSNIFLLDAEERVMALGHQVRQGQSRLRPIGNGDPYQPPPPLGGDRPDPAEPFESWQRRLSLLPLPLERALRESYQGISPALARQLAGESAEQSAAWLARSVDTLDAAGWSRLWQRWCAWLRAVKDQRFCFDTAGPTAYRCWRVDPAAADPAGQEPSGENPALAEPGDGPAQAGDSLPINTALAGYYGTLLAARELQRRQHQLAQQLQAATEREQRQLHQQEALVEAAGGSEALQSQADALLSQFALSREQIDEAQALYRRARKLRRSLAAITPRLERHRQRLAWLEHSRTFLDQADGVEQLEALAEELREGPGGPEGTDSPRGAALAPQPQRRAHRRAMARAMAPEPLQGATAAGLIVQVGRNHRQNEWISLRQARRGDLWFHAQECPGSHVVLKASQAVAGDDDLQAAADLAAHFSRARGNRRVPVVMVPTEELQRIPGAGPGTVRHRGGALLWGEPARAAAWLAQRAADSDAPEGEPTADPPSLAREPGP
ncbi:NFACT family protein [Synechococcus sp. CBW1002]|uniref:Rqc2 family fibronectin-binding protein n=1 Tax=unclassified Synechococcus TaxID=2626047 RepID=UPI0018CD9490|nr:MULTISPECIES: NFACT RNA binding domain-containing protein [unclassified Synechococcus]QPN58710.1 NFACT family protein [Synechococcus sp. CBW1002]QPN65445.1 NFACT family protein [Synechococcus sp. CBW1006]CAK6699336.1 Rqc2 RqcH [Synechococcus sp. CBW1107]